MIGKATNCSSRDLILIQIQKAVGRTRRIRRSIRRLDLQLRITLLLVSRMKRKLINKMRNKEPQKSSKSISGSTKLSRSNQLRTKKKREPIRPEYN